MGRIKHKRVAFTIWIIFFSFIILFISIITFFYGSFENFEIINKIKEFHKLIESNKSIPMEEFFIKEVRDVLDKEPFIDTSRGFDPILNAFLVFGNDSNNFTIGTSDEKRAFNIRKFMREFVIEFVDSNNQRNIFVYIVTKEDGEFKFIIVNHLDEEKKESDEIKAHPRRFKI